MRRSTLEVAVAVSLLLVVAPLAAVAADDAGIPLDSAGLPAWTVKQWTDFPVRIVLDDTDALTVLLSRVEIASFNREQVEPEFSGAKLARLVFEPRVTESEFDALVRAGYAVERVPDLERRQRQEMEALWLRMAVDKSFDPSANKTDVYDYYPTNDQIGTILATVAADYPDIARTFTWGSSVEGRTLHGIVISDNVTVSEAEPEVRLSSTMHGDETPPMVNLMNLVHYLTEHHGEVGYEDVTDLVENYEITILPLYNPDGMAAGQRYNDNNVDLNRNFALPAGTHSVTEVENVQFMTFSNAHHFVISTNGHTGALLTNYPWDYTYTRAPDDAALQQLSLEYSTYNLPMYNGSFPQGITNGADWYVATGTLQDWSYDQTDCIDITCEVSNIKWPSASTLSGIWDDNRESLMHFCKAARYGINGVVTAAGTGQPLDAKITIVGNAQPVYTDPAHGDYYKLLDTGTYDVTVEAVGYVTQTLTEVATVWGTPTVLDVVMQPQATGVVSGTVADNRGAGLDAMVEIRTWPAGELVDAVGTDASGAFTADLFYGDYTLTASATDHFTESRQVTVGATPVAVEFVLGGMIISYPIDEDFESGPGVFSGDWITFTPGHDSDTCLADSEDTYPDNATLIATTTAGVDLTDVMDPQVSFYAKWNLENSWDAVFFELSTDRGSNWTALAVPGATGAASGQGGQQPAGTPCFDDSQANWTSCVVDLTSYIGQTDVRFRFRLVSDTSMHYDGFDLDDFAVRVTTEDMITAVGDDVPVVVAGVRAFPNPFNPATSIRFTNPRAGRVKVAVYDVQGRLLRLLQDGDLPAGRHEVRWDGYTGDGARVGSGVYFARMTAGAETAGAKLVLVK